MKIIYCHHAHRKKGNPPSQNDGITRLGKKDAKNTRSFIEEICSTSKYSVKAIYTSEFFRCTKTSEIINKNLKLPVIIEPRLNEFGSIKGESWVELQERITGFIDEIVETYDENDMIICVTSGVNIAPFIIKSFGTQISDNTPFLWIPSCSPIVFDVKK